MINYLLKKYHYPPEEIANALEAVIKQYEQWTDNEQENYSTKSANVYEIYEDDVQMTAELYIKLLLSGKNKLKVLYLFTHRCCSRFTYPWAWFSVLNCKHYKMCLF